MIETPKIKTVYRARFLTKLLRFIFWTGAAYLGTLFLRDFLVLGNTEDYHPLIVVVIVLALTLLMNHAFTMIILNELILSDEGLEVRRGGIRVFSTWENVHSFVNGWAAGQGRSKGSGVYFHQPVPVKARGLSRIFNESEIKYIQIDCNVSIPTTMGTMKLKKEQFLKTDFGQAVQHFKPNFLK